MTCADDVWVKLFVPKAEVRRVSAALSPPLDTPRLTRRRRQGFWTDLDAYYSSPPQLLSVDQLAGPREDLAQLFRILIALAYVSFLLMICRGRPMLRPLVLTAARSPSAATTRNAPSPSPPTPSSPTSTSRPRHLSEPPTRRSRCRNSPHQASTRRSTSPSSWLLGKSVLDTDERRADGWWESLSRNERERRMDLALSMTKVFDLGASSPLSPRRRTSSSTCSPLSSRR